MAATINEVGGDSVKNSSYSPKCHEEVKVKSSKELLNIRDHDRVEDKLLILKKGKEPKADGPRQTFRPPPSSVLSEVKSFLPKMAKANEDLTTLLSRVPASMVDIESVSENQENVIEMNISMVPSIESDSSDAYDSDSDCSDIAIGEVTEENFRISRTQHKMENKIVELDTGHKSDDNKT